MFKAYLEEQNKTVQESLKLLKDVIAQAYADNKPLLASNQMMDAVFRLYKGQIHGELQAKFDSLIAKKEEEHNQLLAKERAEREEEKAQE